MTGSSRLKAGMLGEWKIRLESSVNEDIKIGVTEEDVAEIIEKEYHEYMTERGERRGWSNESNQVV